MSQKNQLQVLLQTASPAQLIQSPEVADRFKNLYQMIHGAKDGARFYEAEKFHFLKLLQENPKLATCSKLSLYGCFLDVAVNGLSFDPSMKHLYVVPYNTNVGTREVPKWETRANLQISGYGELALRKKFGQIKHADNPILVYEGDEFKMCVKNGRTEIEYQMTLPRKSDNIVGCFLTITRNDGSLDYKVLSIDEIMKLKKFSKDPNSKAWTDGLPGMVQAKTIKHAFKSYPKIRTGEFSQLASETVEEEAEVVETSMMPAHIDYGTGEVSEQTPNIDPSLHHRAVPQQNGHDFTSTNTASAKTVVVEDDGNSDTF